MWDRLDEPMHKYFTSPHSQSPTFLTRVRFWGRGMQSNQRLRLWLLSREVLFPFLSTTFHRQGPTRPKSPGCLRNVALWQPLCQPNHLRMWSS